MFFLRILGTAALAVALAGGVRAADPDHKTITIGATAGPYADQLKYGIKPVLEAQGYTVKVVEFSDYVQPNLALAQGALDANSFQHRPYLNRFAQERKLDITAVVKVPTVPIGLYSRKHRSVDEIQPGARVALPNDPTNQARALVMAEKFGWIRLKPGIDPIKVSERDVAENPKKIRLIALDPALMPRSLDDTDYSFVNGNYAIASGLKLADAVKLEENFHDRYILVAAVRTADKDKPWVRDLVAAYRSPAFEKVIAERFKGFIRPDYATAVDAPLDVARVN